MPPSQYQNQEALVIKKDALSNWFAEDGTMCLSPRTPNGERESYGETHLSTANCDNGPLFAAQFYWLCAELGVLDDSDLARFQIMELLCRVDEHKGLHHRNPGRSRDTEAFDNDVGLVTCGVLFDFPIANAIREYGATTGYIYNNVAPGEINLNLWRQGAEIAFYDMAAGFMPRITDYLWLVGGLFVTLFYDRNKSSEHLLTYMRLGALDRVDQRGMSHCPTIFYAGVGLMGKLWNWRVSKLGGIPALFSTYFHPSHPNARLAALLVK